MFLGTKKISRRGFLYGGAMLGITTVMPQGLLAMSAPFGKEAAKKRITRFAHFTDIHLEPKNGAPDGLTKALRHTQSLKDKPEMIITGGDNIMDAMDTNGNWANIQFETLKKTIAKECHIPIKYCIGNHDVWGWNKEKSQTTGDEPLWGKKMVLKQFGLDRSYCSFSKGRWHFIILDSVFPDGNNYTGKLDDEQFEWLRVELKSNKDSHVCIISHIPILSVAAYFGGDCEKSGRWTLYDENMHIDARRLKDLFAETNNVRLCISGHLHYFDIAQYDNVWYVCDGAISGAWWGGDHGKCDEGFGVFDLYDDGTFGHEYITYGWEPVRADYVEGRY